MQSSLTKFLKAIGEDPAREGLKKTPERFEKALRELTSGYDQKPEEIINSALFAADSNDPVIVKDIEFASLCEHHLLPFIGKISVGYIPEKHIIGLSKIPRIVDIFAKRLQTQEHLGRQICDALNEALKPKGIAVVIEAEHLCMKIRGAKALGKVVTQHTSGTEIDNLFQLLQH